MTQATLLSDDLLRRLMAVGQVDIVVGIPTLNDAGTIGPVLNAVHEGLVLHFPRARTVIIGADGGSNDGTREIVAGTALPASGGGSTSRQLRTQHQIEALYRGVPGTASALRLIFTAADLLQARAVTVFDPLTAGVTPPWIGAMLDPVATESFDFVAPIYGRHPLERLLITQLIRPVMRTAYGVQIDDPLMGDFACSTKFAAHCLAQDVWDRSPISERIELWLTATALAGGFRACQVNLSPRSAASSARARPALSDVFAGIVGSLFTCLERHADDWMQREAVEPLPVFGPERQRPPLTAPVDPSRLGATFPQDVRDLHPVLESILAADTAAALSAAADAATGGVVAYPDDVWVSTVYDFLAAHHAGVMDRAHIAQALMPLYLGRAASFARAHAESPDVNVVQDLDRLSQEFAQRKPYLIERWKRTY